MVFIILICKFRYFQDRLATGQKISLQKKHKTQKKLKANRIAQ